MFNMGRMMSQCHQRPSLPPRTLARPPPHPHLMLHHPIGFHRGRRSPRGQGPNTQGSLLGDSVAPGDPPLSCFWLRDISCIYMCVCMGLGMYIHVYTYVCRSPSPIRMCHV